MKPSRATLLSSALLLLLWTLALSCQSAVVEPPPAKGLAAPSRVRRLTQEELNRTLVDLFPAVVVPAITIIEDNGKDFAQLENRQVVSDLYVEQVRAGMNAVTAAIAGAQAVPAAGEEGAVVSALLEDLLPLVLRRPVATDEHAFFLDYFGEQQAISGFAPALQLMLQVILQSPAFLYRLELDDSSAADDRGRVPVSSIEMATRLSYFLWGTTPDAELLQAGVDGTLSTAAGITAQAARMLGDARAMDAVQSFHRQWLDFDRILQTNKSPLRFPSYNEFLRQAMRDEASRFIELVFEQDAKLRTLLTSRQARLIPALGPLYGVDVSEDNQLVELPPERAGILTQAQFLAARAHAVEGSPVLRGVFVLERLVCEQPPPPGADIDTTPPQAEDDDGSAARTNRSRYAQHAADPLCASCHRPIDGIGFGLEAFDAIGQFRTLDNGLPVDDSGDLGATRVGGTFKGAADLGARLASSPVVSSCVAQHWFRFANGRPDQSSDKADLAVVNAAFVAADGDVRALLKAIVLSEAFRLRRQP